MASQPNINNNFFEGSYKEVWRKIIPPGLTEAEVDFIIEVAGLKPKDSVLDLMCGYGRRRSLPLFVAKSLKNWF